MNKSTHRIYRKPILTAVIVAIIAALSVSAYAIVALLSPAEIARETGYTELAKVFESGKGKLIDESVTSEGHVLTLMGMTSGKNLMKYVDVDATQTAFVISVRREDGQPISIENGVSFMSTAFFEGYRPWMFSSFMLGSGANAFVRDGVYYMVFSINEDIEMLADRTVSLGIWDRDALGFAPGSALLTMKDDGTIAFVEGLQGAHAMFTLPLDASKADPARVAQVLAEQGYSPEDIQLMQTPVQPDEVSPEIQAEASSSGAILKQDPLG